jgi:hypothetical protein
MSLVTLTLGLLNGSLVVVLPGPSGTQRTIPLPRGKEQELLRIMLQAKEAGEKGIETLAEPTGSLAFHLAHHKRVLVDTCPHCRAEQDAYKSTKVKRYGPRGGLLKGRRTPPKKMTMDEMLIAISTMSKEERDALLSDLTASQSKKGT